VKPILVLIAAVIAIGLAIPTDASGQAVTQTTELSLTPEQLGEEIAAWKQQLAGLVKDLSDPSLIWIRLPGGEVLATDDEELVGALREGAIFDLIWRPSKDYMIGDRDFSLEIKSVFRERVESYVKEAYAELVKQDKAIREIKEQQAERLREIIRGLEKKRADVLAAQPRQAGAPAFKPDEATVSASEIAAVKRDLEPIRLREKWDLRDHGYVLGYLDKKVKTPSQLRLVKKLIADISACYQAWNAENARIAEAARAGNWMPGKRIEAGSKALNDREDRLQRIKSSFEDDWLAP
jgi:hypothetical protein